MRDRGPRARVYTRPMGLMQHKPTRVVARLPAGTGQKPRRRLRLSGDGLLIGALVYGMLAFYVTALYVLVLALGGVSNQNENILWWMNLVALIMIVLTFLPVRGWLQRGVTQLVYGQHDNPYALLSQVNVHLEATQPSPALAPAIATSIAATLKLPYVAIETQLGPETLTTAYGAPPPHADLVTIPLAYRDTALGTLRVAARGAHEQLSLADTKLLHDLARQVGITLHAAQLTDALQMAREHLVTAREEERRRIRRDLHDGLGPTLAALRLQLGAVRRVLRQDPDQAEAMIDTLRDDVRVATATIRQLVYGLRPPLLDELGLVGAIHALDLTAHGISLTVIMPDHLPPLPAALEVALYRIAAEATQNVARHARATNCTVQIEDTPATLTLTVTDNGIGLPPEHATGVGFVAMRERADELGGGCVVATLPQGGTRVTATIPWRKPA